MGENATCKKADLWLTLGHHVKLTVPLEILIDQLIGKIKWWFLSRVRGRPHRESLLLQTLSYFSLLPSPSHTSRYLVFEFCTELDLIMAVTSKGKCILAPDTPAKFVAPENSSSIELLGLSGKSECIMLGLSGRRRRRRNEGKSSRKTKHRPKVLDKAKIGKHASTPKHIILPITPNLFTPKRRANLLRHIDPVNILDSTEKSSRRRIDFDIGCCSSNQSENVYDGRKSNRFTALGVYRRILRPNECLKNSRKLGPNFPFIFKKPRMRRLKPIAFDKLLLLLRTSPIAQEMKIKPVDLDQIMRNRKTRPRTLNQRKSKFPWVTTECAALEKSTLNLTWKARKGRCKTSTRESNLSSFINDLSLLQFSDSFLSRVSAIRVAIRVAEDYSSACVEAQNGGSDVETPLFVGLCGVDDVDLGESQICEDYSSACVEAQNGGSDVETPLFVGLCGVDDVDLGESQIWDDFTKALVDFATRKVECLNLNVPTQELILKHDLNPEREVLELVPKVDLTPEREDDEATNYWKEERELYEGRFDEFIAILYHIQGSMKYSAWKGSIVDSVVGVFLTQNVGDNLSSGAFMSLRERYRPLHMSEDIGNDGKSEIVIHNSEKVKIALSPSLSSDECGQPLIIENDGNEISSYIESTSGGGKGKNKLNKEPPNWDKLRVKYSQGVSKNRTEYTTDSVDWEAVRQATVDEVAKAIMGRGMNNLLARRIKDFLERLAKDHGSIDLEWLRDAMPEETKAYLLSIPGLGLKSVECVRLLALQQQAFPVDVNIARVAVRRGWVPLQALPEGVEIHHLNDYPNLDNVQQFLWPLLQQTICTKRNPNCSACPFTASCKHYASMSASARPRLKGPHVENSHYQSSERFSQESMVLSNLNIPKNCEPIIEMPESPVREGTPDTDADAHFPLEFEDHNDEEKEILTLKLRFIDREDDGSKTLITLRPDMPSFPRPKLKDVKRLRTEHIVYELPPSHPLLAGFDKLIPNDRFRYLLAIWMTDETTGSSQDPRKENNRQESTNSELDTPSGQIVKYRNELMVQGTILIPCRTANRGSFPLNGTYFQVNEVFADHDSSLRPIDVPREWVWNLRRRPLYCGTSIHSICRGELYCGTSMHSICRGYVCIRGMDRKTTGPRPLQKRFHFCKTRPVNYWENL
ncbi:Transcriptional activator DEMETER [Striga hermonthica]|uniref:Transcriptional activator DEMETER n=1 Tax=Striga hermonthica TaxID=68872 RepID=A0A9N7NK12_STRHE|nr:Transcriptional activator DEMETER [Striga hermonthica]